MKETTTVLLTIKEAAERLRVTPATIYNLVKDKHFSIIKIGSHSRIDEGDLESYIAKQKQ